MLGMPGFLGETAEGLQAAGQARVLEEEGYRGLRIAR